MYFSVHLVELQGAGELYAMKAMEKSIMLNRNKVWNQKLFLWQLATFIILFNILCAADIWCLKLALAFLFYLLAVVSGMHG